MSTAEDSSIKTVLQSVHDRIDSVCDEFEQALISGSDVQIEDYLSLIDEPNRAALFRELLILEKAHASKKKLELEAESYVGRFPEFELEIRATFDESKSNLFDAVAIPKTIGRYKIESLLGEGGFGRVFLAFDSELQRKVAVKIPRPRLIARPEILDLYQQEARSVAQLDHPNIASVFDVGSTDDFPFYFVSQYVEGTTLKEEKLGRRPTRRKSIEWITQIADALHYAHAQGIIHRDVKPGNILIEARTQRALLLDFGLALNDANLGTGPVMAGTPAYMSPEQANGEGHRVDGRADIFSLGVILYELLTGRAAFREHRLAKF